MEELEFPGINSTKLFVTLLALSLGAVVFAQSNGIDAAGDEPSQEYLPPTEEANAAKLADDGYRYKTIRKLKYRARHRREVNQEYLPPVNNEPTQEYLPPGEEKAEDGYRYKTVRTLKFRSRHRRDVSEIEQPSKDYLPPVDVELAPDLKTVLGDDGYRYKTVRRLKFRRHRREADMAAAADKDAAAAYLPPAEEMPADEANADMPEAKSAELAQDGYRYKTVRRIRYRYRQ
ncbi:uncharacterized protein LOC106090059 [Stomoxys calcitrans]|uniref:uncharacterized protein LOC106090059 n=1 Tax=Stomoxys calcitrans TaxID=35570 RepID=UPI0027E304C3|nr:uncharacterized protein LOC106090059 [Stomoxys calcitrans]